jgi:PmbA protein
MEELLDMALREAQAAEVIEVASEEERAEFKAGKLKGLEKKESRGWGLRVIRKGKIGFSSSTDHAKRKELVESAITSARYGQEARFRFPPPIEPQQVRTKDPSLIPFSLSQGIQHFGQGVEIIQEANPSIYLEGYIQKEVVRERIINSQGLECGFERTSFDLLISSLLVEREGLLPINEVVFSGRLRLEGKKLARSLLKKAEMAKRITHVRSGKLPVIFAPEALLNLLAAIEMGVNGKLVEKGSSPLCGRLGDEVLNPRVNLYDDGTVDLLQGSRPLDGEGVPTRRIPLFEKGVLKNYLFDLQTGGMMERESTGNADRSYDTQPRPGINNLILEPGEKSIEEMIEQIDEGIIVYEVLGGGQSNLLAGDFSLNVDLGYKIEKGEITGRIKDSMVSGNVYEAFGKIQAIGRELKEIGEYLIPPVALDSLSVSGKE